MTWAALSAEIAVELRGYAEYERDLMDIGEWLRADERQRERDERRVTVVPRQVVWQRKRRASMTEAERTAALEARRAYARSRRAESGASQKTCGKCGQRGHNARGCRGVVG